MLILRTMHVHQTLRWQTKRVPRAPRYAPQPSLCLDSTLESAVVPSRDTRCRRARSRAPVRGGAPSTCGSTYFCRTVQRMLLSFAAPLIQGLRAHGLDHHPRALTKTRPGLARIPSDGQILSAVLTLTTSPIALQEEYLKVCKPTCFTAKAWTTAGSNESSFR